MKTWLITLLIAAGGILVSFFFEAGRDFWADVWDYLVDGICEIPDFFASMFENIGELSFYGLGFGALSFILIFALRKRMIEPFVAAFPPAGKLFWTIVTYIGVFVGGYFIGKHFENT